MSLYAYVNPLLAVLLGTWLAQEPFGWRVVVAAFLVILGVAVVRGQAVSLAPLCGRKVRIKGSIA